MVVEPGRVTLILNNMSFLDKKLTYFIVIVDKVSSSSFNIYRTAQDPDESKSNGHYLSKASSSSHIQIDNCHELFGL